ncbi:hypothetical protein [Nocardia sp. NPDC004123]
MKHRHTRIAVFATLAGLPTAAMLFAAGPAAAEIPIEPSPAAPIDMDGWGYSGPSSPLVAFLVSISAQAANSLHGVHGPV